MRRVRGGGDGDAAVDQQEEAGDRVDSPNNQQEDGDSG